jgi:nitrate reductase delta subunit
MRQHAYCAFATLLTYPEVDYSQFVRSLTGVLPPECLDHVAGFQSAVVGLSLEAQQELFTQTFDLNPVCSLELGWHLFGENYERGLLLVRMREELRAAGIAEQGELPDHLNYALRLLPTMSQERAMDFAGAIALPALMKMLQAVRGKENPYEGLLSALAVMLHEDFPEIRLPEPKVELPVFSQEVAP